MAYVRHRIAERYARAAISLDQLVRSHDDAPTVKLVEYLLQQCWRALDMCKHEYDPASIEMGWDDVNMIVDRHPGSLSGGLGEIALMVDPRFSTYGVPRPVLDKVGQVDMGLDFITGEKTHQVKSGIISRTGGAIEVTPDLFRTTADYVHILTRWEGSSIWYGTTTLIWNLMIAAEVARYAGEKQPKQFVLDREDMFRLGVVETLTYDWATT